MSATICTRPECQTSAGCQCQRANRRFVVSSVEWPPHNDPRIASLEAALAEKEADYLRAHRDKVDNFERALKAEAALAEARRENERLREALRIYAEPKHWAHQHRVLGHGDAADVLTWVGPTDDDVYGMPTRGPEYARDALEKG